MITDLQNKFIDDDSKKDEKQKLDSIQKFEIDSWRRTSKKKKKKKKEIKK